MRWFPIDFFQRRVVERPEIMTIITKTFFLTMTPGRITCQSVHSGILFQVKRVFVDSGIMWKFSMTPMGFNRWTDRNETFPYLKRKRIIVVMLFLFFFGCLFCACVYFLQCLFLLFLFIYLFIYLLLASLMRAPKLFSTIARKSQFENLLDVSLEDAQYCQLAFLLSRVFTLVR